MKITLNARVKFSAGAYNCAIHKARGSSTMNAETAVRRAAERYVAGGALAVAGVRYVSGTDVDGGQVWEVCLGKAA